MLGTPQHCYKRLTHCLRSERLISKASREGQYGNLVWRGAGSPPGQEGRQEGNGLFNIHGLPDKNGGLEQSFCDMTIIC